MAEAQAAFAVQQPHDIPVLYQSPDVDPTQPVRKEPARYDVMRSSIVDSIHRSHVIRDISPTRVYACNKESHAALPDLFRQPKALEHLRPLKKESKDKGDNGTRQPRLLQRLEYLLEEKIRLANSLASPYASPGDEAGRGASNMRLDAYRQAFEAFIHSFTTYRPLLLRIKSQYDVALEDALESAHENIHMKAELAVIEQRQLRAIEEARVAAGDYVAESRRELEQRLMAMEERAAAAEERVRAAETAARSARAEEERALGDRDGLMLKMAELRTEMLSNSAWAKSLAEKDRALRAKAGLLE